VRIGYGKSDKFLQSGRVKSQVEVEIKLEAKPVSR